MLSPWARRHRRWKKSLAWRLYARRDFLQADVLHATSQLEADELRAVGARQPIAVIPNGVDAISSLPVHVPRPSRPYVLFMSRIHRKKGVLELLDVWQQLDRRDWDLVLAGPDEERLLVNAKLPANVRYVGSVDGSEKVRLLQKARLFVLPSYSENFGVVVAESLMAGVPVISTHGTPWESLVRERCGWWIPMQRQPLEETLQEAISTSPEDLQAMGRRGREFAFRAFAWPEIARQMAEVYQWVLGGGAPPACVETA
jgi:glycosyltransferase involved in cell wall biosynthesis